MVSKNVKVIDEHNIDRNANIICAIDVSGSDYVVYWIERDNENDNIFVSKLIKNIDNTSSMINIDDSMEKGMISDIVKELIKYSIDNENNKLNASSITLPSGKNVDIISVLINKEQNINVQKTYITTVKKTVTKVSEDFYTKKDEIVEETNSVVFPAVTPVKEVISEPVAPVIEPVVVSQELPVSQPVVEQVSEPAVVNTVPLEVPKVESVVSVPLEQKEEPTIVSPITKPVEPVVNVVPEVPSTPVVASTIVQPEPTPVVEVPVDNRLVFDASKESNLNDALGEVSKDGVVSVDSVEPIREFGVDNVAPVQSVAPVSSNNVAEVQPAETFTRVRKNSGFANNKFFMIIAIAFFLASCIFLGYEVFNYFQVK